MNADIEGALRSIKQKPKSYKAFTHRDRFLSKEQVIRVLEYGLAKGYKTTDELSDKEVDAILGWHFEIN
jgi:hypothetical protein